MTESYIESGAEFSNCRKFRFALWRIWDKNLPNVMFIGLNPSTANEEEADNTIRRVVSIAKNNGFGGVYMMNCFPFVSTDPGQLQAYQDSPRQYQNTCWIIDVSESCSEIVFAWGNFKVVKDTGRDVELMKLFPNAKALHINKNGSPKHPLYCRVDSVFVPFREEANHA